MPLVLADLLKNTDYNAKIKDIEDKVPTALTAVENEIPDIIKLVKK